MARIKPDNMRHDGEDDSYASIDAARSNTQAPRWIRNGEGSIGRQLVRVSGVGFLRHAPHAIACAIIAKWVFLSWLPHPRPTILLTAVCVLFSAAVKGHSPDDMRYAGLRAILQSTSFALLSIRWISGFTTGWENNCWWLITWLPDGLRGLGNVDSVLRMLLVDPLALLLTWLWFVDTWIPAKISSAMTGRTIWNGYRAPKASEHRTTMVHSLPTLPFLLSPMPTMTSDWVYALALGLGGSFLVGYVLIVEVLDVLCVARKNVATRSRHFAKYSDRRYVVLRAIAYGIPRLLGLSLFGIAAIFFAGKDQWLSLLPIAIILGGCFLLYPFRFGLAWEAVDIFESYPGGQPARAGVHDFSEVIRDPNKRLNLVTFAAFAWVPFVYGCVHHFLPGFPQFDGWAVRWPDLRLESLLFALVLLCLLPGQLFCGVVQACYGPMLAIFASWDDGRGDGRKSQ